MKYYIEYYSFDNKKYFFTEDGYKHPSGVLGIGTIYSKDKKYFKTLKKARLLVKTYYNFWKIIFPNIDKFTIKIND